MQASTVVGYQTKTVTGLDENEAAKWYFVAVQFKGTGEQDDVIKFSDLISNDGIPAVAWSKRTKKDGTGAACIEVQNEGGSYDYYYYVNNAYSTEAKTSGDNVHTGWAKGQVLAEGISTSVLKLGTGFWFTDPNLGHETATLTFAGEVKSELSKTFDIKGTETTILSNPYPVALKIGDIKTTAAAVAWSKRTKKDGTGAPCIEVQNEGGSYDYYYYVNNAYSTAAKTSGDNIHTGWAKAQVLAGDTDVLEVGEAFWIVTNELPPSTLTINFGSQN